MDEDVSITVTGEMETVPEASSQKNNIFRFLSPTNTLTFFKTWLLTRWQYVRPWTTFLNTSNFKAAYNVPRLTKRIAKNIEHFQGNYVFVFLGLIAYCLLTSPILLIIILGSFFVGYKLVDRHSQKKLSLLGRELTVPQIYGLTAICSCPFYLWAGAGSILFWVLGASFFVITLHAAFYNIDAILEPDEETFDLIDEQTQEV